MMEKPVLEKPVTERPVLEKPVLERPVTERPVTERPVMEKPVLEKPVLEKPAAEIRREPSSLAVSDIPKRPIPIPVQDGPILLRPVVKQPMEKASPSISQQPLPSSEKPTNPNAPSPTTPSQEQKKDSNVSSIEKYINEHIDEITKYALEIARDPHYVNRPRQPYGQKPGNQPYGKKPNNQPYGQKPNNQPYGQKPNNQPYGQKPNNQPYGQKPNNQPYGQKPNNQPYGQKPNNQPYGQKPYQNAQKPLGNPNNAVKNGPKPKAETFHVSSNLKYTPSLRLVELVFSPDPLPSHPLLTCRNAPHRSPPMDQRYMLAMLTPLPYDHYPSVWLSHTDRVLMRPFDILCHYMIGS